MSCKINTGLIPTSCSDIAIGGDTGRFWLINFNRFLEATITKGVNGEITNIVAPPLVAGEQFAYRFETQPKSITTGNTFTGTNGISGLTHLFSSFIADLSMEQKNSLSTLINMGFAIVIIETQAEKLAVPVDSKSPPYILFGEYRGLETSVTDTNLSDQAIGNGIQLTLTTPANGRLEINYPVNVIMTTSAIELLENVAEGFPYTFPMTLG